MNIIEIIATELKEKLISFKTEETVITYNDDCIIVKNLNKFYKIIIGLENLNLIFYLGISGHRLEYTCIDLSDPNIDVIKETIKILDNYNKNYKKL